MADHHWVAVLSPVRPLEGNNLFRYWIHKKYSTFSQIHCNCWCTKQWYKWSWLNFTLLNVKEYKSIVLVDICCPTWDRGNSEITTFFLLLWRWRALRPATSVVFNLFFAGESTHPQAFSESRSVWLFLKIKCFSCRSLLARFCPLTVSSH